MGEAGLLVFAVPCLGAAFDSSTAEPALCYHTYMISRAEILAYAGNSKAKPDEAAIAPGMNAEKINVRRDTEIHRQIKQLQAFDSINDFTRFEGSNAFLATIY